MAWELHHNKTIGRFLASFPEHNPEVDESFPDWVELTVGESKGYFRTAIRERADGNHIWVSPKDLKNVSNGTQVSHSETSEWRYHHYRIKNDRELKLTLVGLVFVLAGLIVDGALALGKIIPIFIVSRHVIVGSMVLSLIVKIVGAVLVFWKGVLEKGK